MRELYSIMRDFLEVEYNQKSLLYVLQKLEASYENEKDETKCVINGARFYLESLQRELKSAVSRLDSYVAENVKSDT